MLFYPEKPEEIPVDISQRLHETKTQSGVISGVVSSTSSNSGTSFNATHVPLVVIVQPMENYGKQRIFELSIISTRSIMAMELTRTHAHIYLYAYCKVNLRNTFYIFSFDYDKIC